MSKRINEQIEYLGTLFHPSKLNEIDSFLQKNVIELINTHKKSADTDYLATLLYSYFIEKDYLLTAAFNERFKKFSTSIWLNYPHTSKKWFYPDTYPNEVILNNIYRHLSLQKDTKSYLAHATEIYDLDFIKNNNRENHSLNIKEVLLVKILTRTWQERGQMSNILNAYNLLQDDNIQINETEFAKITKYTDFKTRNFQAAKKIHHLKNIFYPVKINNNTINLELEDAVHWSNFTKGVKDILYSGVTYQGIEVKMVRNLEQLIKQYQTIPALVEHILPFLKSKLEKSRGGKIRIQLENAVLENTIKKIEKDFGVRKI